MSGVKLQLSESLHFLQLSVRCRNSCVQHLRAEAQTANRATLLKVLPADGTSTTLYLAPLVSFLHRQTATEGNKPAGITAADELHCAGALVSVWVCCVRYLEHLLDLLSRQVHVEFVQKLKNLVDAQTAVAVLIGLSERLFQPRRKTTS